MPGPVAVAAVEVRADFTKFGPQIVAGARQAGQDAGQELETKLEDAGRKAGDKTSSAFSSGFTKVTSKLTVVSGAFTAVFGAITIKAQKAEEQQIRLEAAVDRTGKEFDNYKDDLKGAIKEQEKFGFTASEVRDGLLTLTRRLGDPDKAFQQLGLVADIAADKNISFGAATSVVAKLLAGNARAFKEYGINIKENKELTKAAEGAAKDFTGAQERLGKAQQDLSDLEEVLAEKRSKGQSLTVSDEHKLRDARREVADATTEVDGTSSALKDTNDKLAKSTGDASRAMEELGKKLDGLSEKKADTARGKLDRLQATIANYQETIGKKFGPSLTIASGALTFFGGVATIVGTAVQLEFGAALGVIGLAVAAFAASFVLTTVILENWGDDIARIFGNVVGWVADLPGRIASAASGLWNGITDSFRNAINKIIIWWDNLHLIIPGVKILGKQIFPEILVQTKFIKPLAKGGVTSGPMLALLGDNPSGKERVTPLDSWGRDPNAMSGVMFGPGSVVVSFSGAVPSEAQAYTTGQAVGRGITAEMARANARRARRVS